MKKEWWIWVVIIIVLIVVGVLLYMGTKRVQYSAPLSDEVVDDLVKSGQISEAQAVSLRGGEPLETAAWWPFCSEPRPPYDIEPADPGFPCYDCEALMRYIIDPPPSWDICQACTALHDRGPACQGFWDGVCSICQEACEEFEDLVCLG